MPETAGKQSKALIDGGYDGKTVVMGIRPENVTDDATAFPESTVEAKINVYELLGAEVFLYFDVEGFNMTARVDPHTTSRTGDTVKFGLDMTKVHVFDKENRTDNHQLVKSKYTWCRFLRESALLCLYI